MRADRLISLIMLLQARGRMTASSLAAELGVSERTIYRDMTVLSAAGVPVYGEAGLAGGYSLVDSYRTSLTGLTPSEVRALFMLQIPEPLAALGMDQDLKSALRKLSAALPESRRVDEERTLQRFHLDASGWRQAGGFTPYLHILYQAAWQDQCVKLTYQPMSNVEIEQVVEPYGLVMKAGAWYLVYRLQDKFRVHEINTLHQVQLLEQSFIRSRDFNLAAFWSGWCAQVKQSALSYPVILRVAPHMLPWLPRLLGGAIGESEHLPPSEAEEWIRLEVRFASLEEARNRLLSLGGGVEVVAPRALQLSLLDYAQQVIARYR